MINKETLTTKWLDKLSKENRNADKILIEKVIRALLLLEGLSNSGLPFIFKGGTSLMLLLESEKRLSIDIDIILSEKRNDLDEIFNSFVKEQGFTKVEIQHRTLNSMIEKAHYKFFYDPIHQVSSGEQAILLDILFETNHYTNLVDQKLTSKFLKSTEPLAVVKIPSLEDLLGDKLTAFAPNTTGIPYFKNDDSQSMEIIKQLYDIGNLFDVASDMDVVSKTFYNIAEVEIEYRQQSTCNTTMVLEDIFKTALCISLRGAEDKEHFELLQTGIQRVERFIFSEKYHIEKAIVHAAKAAYLSRLILHGKKQIEKFENPLKVSEFIIEQPHNTKLNKLKKSNPEAFFYWYKAVDVL